MITIEKFSSHSFCKNYNLKKKIGKCSMIQEKIMMHNDSNEQRKETEFENKRITR